MRPGKVPGRGKEWSKHVHNTHTITATVEKTGGTPAAVARTAAEGATHAPISRTIEPVSQETQQFTSDYVPARWPGARPLAGWHRRANPNERVPGPGQSCACRGCRLVHPRSALAHDYRAGSH